MGMVILQIDWFGLFWVWVPGFKKKEVLVKH